MLMVLPMSNSLPWPPQTASCPVRQETRRSDGTHRSRSRSPVSPRVSGTVEQAGARRARSLQSAGRLAYLDQVTVRIPDVAADLGLVLLGRGEEPGPARTPLGVGRLDVRDPDVEEAADPVGVAWRFERHARLVVGGAATHVD